MHDTKRLGWHGSGEPTAPWLCSRSQSQRLGVIGHVHRLTSAGVISVLVDHFGGLGFSEHPAAGIGPILGRALMVIGIGPVSLFLPDWRNAGCSSFVSRLADAFRSGGKENFRLRQMRTRQKRQGRMPTAAKTQVKVSPVRSPQATREAALQARVAELEDELQTRDDFPRSQRTSFGTR
jgi:hypothetical protein